jgi:predicted dehydrogenase
MATTTKKTRVAFLGSGLMSRKHGIAVGTLKNAEVVGIIGRNPENAAALAKEIGGQTYASVAECIEKAKPDALYVCIPPGAHKGECEYAAAKGVHLFMEKPIARTLKRGKSILEACRKAGIVTQVGYNMHYHPFVQKVKELIDNGSAGKPTLFDAIYYCNSPHKDWWRSDSLSGGQVFEQGIHLYEMSMHFLGKPVRIASFLDNLCHKEMPGYEVDDTGSSSIKFDSGAIASISITNCAVPGLWKLGFTLVCEKLTVFFDGLGKARFVYTGGKENKTEELEGNHDSHLRQTEAFIKAVQGKGKAEPTIEQGYESLRLVDAALRSSKQGRIITL